MDDSVGNRRLKNMTESINPQTEQATHIAVLYSFRRCPYAMRARLALLASGAEYELREVDLKRKPAHMLQLSPKATVPVLWLSGSDTAVIDESLQIMLWALQQSDPLGWLDTHGGMDEQAMKLIKHNDEVFKTHLDRYKYPGRYGLAHGLEHRELARQTLAHLEELFAARRFLGGNAFGFLDAALAPFIRQFAKTDWQWFSEQPYPKLIDWIKSFECSEWFKSIMVKTPIWA
jgi:glutathione S-transferase